MKQHVVPTSPKSSERPPVRTGVHQTFIAVVVGIVFGISGGIVGAIYTHNLLNPLGDSGATALFRFSRDASTNAVDMSVARKSVVAIYATKSSTRTYADFVTSAVVVSSDGWLVAPSEGIVAEPLTAVLPNGDEVAVQSVVERADMGITFLRIARVDLSPASILQNAPHVGDELIAVQGSADWEQYRRSVVTERTEQPETLSSTTFSSTLRVDTEGLRSPLFSEHQALVGLIASDGHLIPAPWITSAFDRLTVNVGIPVSFSYESLDHYTAAYKKLQGLPVHGFRVLEAAEPFEVGDIITAIDGNDIIATMDFASIMASRTSGALMSASIIRAGQPLSVSFQAW